MCRVVRYWSCTVKLRSWDWTDHVDRIPQVLSSSLQRTYCTTSHHQSFPKPTPISHSLPDNLSIPEPSSNLRASIGPGDIMSSAHSNFLDVRHIHLANHHLDPHLSKLILYVPSWSTGVSFLQRACEIVRTAIDEDLKQNWEESLKLYKNALDYFHMAYKCWVVSEFPLIQVKNPEEGVEKKSEISKLMNLLFTSHLVIV